MSSTQPLPNHHSINNVNIDTHSSHRVTSPLLPGNNITSPLSNVEAVVDKSHVGADGKGTGKKRSRTIASQACDSCRGRKIRCEFTAGDEGRVKSCRGCQDIQLPCTFDMPVKRRGPMSKAAKAMASATSPSGVSPMSETNSPRPPMYEPRNAPSSEPKTPFPNNLPSPYELGTGIQLPPIQGHSPNLFHLRYTQPSPSVLLDSSPTDQICPRELFDEIMQDYLDLLYPLVPLVHVPSFQHDLKNRRETYDKPFLAFVVSICAAVVAHMPSRFYHYKSRPVPLRFPTRKAMVDFCHEYVFSLRKADWYDEMSFVKFATSYMLGCAAVHMKSARNRAKMLNVETTQQAMLLNFHCPNTNDGVNCIDMQLRKKAFWLCFFGFVHQRVELSAHPYIVIYTEQVLESFSTLDVLLPYEVDDEYITPTRYYSQPQHRTSLTVGFNANCRIFWAAVSSRSNRVLASTLSHAPLSDQLASLQERLHRVKRALDFIIDVQPQLATWTATSPLPQSTEDEVRDNQWESIRANVHVSSLWLQSMLFDQIITLTERTSLTNAEAANSSRDLWNEREDICRQLLHVLYNISAQNLEPNGNVLVNKIRAVATTLLDCPFSQQGDIARRAHSYITNFAELLSRIDMAHDASPSQTIADPSTNASQQLAANTFNSANASERCDIASIVNPTPALLPAMMETSNIHPHLVGLSGGGGMNSHHDNGGNQELLGNEAEEMERTTQQFWADLDRYSRRGISEFSVGVGE